MKSIDQVISELDEIIQDCKSNKSSLGYFPVLYRKVTIRVKEGILNNEFDDNERMERLDVIFADRYIEAFKNFQEKRTLTESWRITFMQENSPLLIMQHILLGINAHINLDLGVAAAQTMNNKKVDALQKDFNGINDLLASMIDDFQDKINSVSPLFKILDKVAGNTEEKLVQFSINIARKGAWKFTKEFSNSSDSSLILENRDSSISKLANKLVQPKSWLIKIAIMLIRLFEKKNPEQVMQILEE